MMMKKIVNILAILVLSSNWIHAIGVADALKAGQITLSGQSTSGYTESKIVVKNTRTYSLDVDFSTACFVQNNQSQRVGLAYEKSTGSYYLRLSAGRTYTLYFSSRCLDKTRSSPSTGVGFRTVRSISSFPEIVACLRNNYSQEGVWSITNGSGTLAQRWQAADPRPPVGGGGGSSTVGLQGSAYWSISGNQINIQASKVVNLGTNTTGSLRLQVWVTRSRYTGGSISGYVVGTKNLGTLRAGYAYTGISGYVSYTRPPSGTYYDVITVEEYTSGGWVIRDFATSGTSQLFR